MKTILLTGGRAPATLALARIFAAAGHRVLVAESLSEHLCKASRAVARHFTVPAPKRDPAGFGRALAAIAAAERVDLLVPTCEEVFWVARAYAAIAEHTEVFTRPLAELCRLHSKWAFIQRVAELGERAPATWLLQSPDDLPALRAGEAAGLKLVVKPVYSRFASQVTVLAPTAPSPRLKATPAAPWVAQAFVEGRQICTYSVCRDGAVTAHAAYAANFTAGLGSCIDFGSLDHPALAAWVARFARAEGYTGQLAFDFIEAADGALYPLECNPRATSGVNLFAPGDGLERAFLEDTGAPVTPRSDAHAMIGLAMWAYGLGSVQSPSRLLDWCQVVARSRDVVFAPDDPLPFWQQLPVMGDFWLKSRWHGITMLEASTLDIEWNGEP